MIVGIDAANIRGGGGVTHLVELLRAADPARDGFSQIVVWGSKATLGKLEERPWLVKSHQSMLDKGLFLRTYWQRFKLSSLARKSGCDVLFVPGGSFAGNFRPMVAFNQNLLPFEWSEIKRYGLSWATIKWGLLHVSQTRTFRRADGLIFLTNYARNVVVNSIKSTPAITAIVPHGIDSRFKRPPREQVDVNGYSAFQPFKLLYVSSVEMYKHQWHVADAVARLRNSGIPVVLDLVGAAYPPALRKLRKTLDKLDPQGEFLRYLGAVPHESIHGLYAGADLCVFASSCETFGQILTEAMLAGLPIACSNRSSLPEILGDAGVYFDPEDPEDIAGAIRKLIDDPALRLEKAKASSERAQAYSWERCARETFACITKVTNQGDKCAS